MLTERVLENSLLQVFNNKGGTPISGARALASAYKNYASSAQAGLSLPTFTGMEQATFVSAILPAMNPMAGKPPIFANAMATAVASFWLVPPVVFAGGSGAGPVILFAGQPALVQALTGILSNPLNTENVAAALIATALDIATRTITAQLVLGPSTVTYPLS